jgi:tetratricopeptide (TPR) repeat protein
VVPSTTTEPEPLTIEGVTVGTVAYMSPEQVTGELLDGRTDLFSLGIVLYECVTGRRPFAGKTSAVILSAILNEAPVAPIVFNPHIPARLQDVINNCLEKDRELRYQDAAGLRADLRRVRRDLESGQSAAAKTIVKSAGGARRSSTAAAGRLDEGAPPRRPLLLGWGALVAAASVLGFAAYWVSFRTPEPSAPPPAATFSAPEPPDRSRVDLAISSLNARRYREALGYAREVLQSSPDNPEAQRVRDEATAALQRFDDAIARGERLLSAGDPDGASAALRAAREIDPTAPAVTSLQEQIVSQYRGLARSRQESTRAAASTTSGGRPPDERTAQREPPRAPAPVAAAPPPASPGPTKPPEPAPSASVRPPEPAQSAPVNPPEPAPPVPVKPPEPTQAGPLKPPAPASTDPAAAPSPAAANASGATPRPKPDEPAPPRAAAAAPAAPAVAPKPPPENDDVLITRVIDAWARAIENKDLAGYRALKPNMTAAEQRRIEEGFRAVSSQRVSITILGIEKRGTQAVVRLRRRDAIVVDGRPQTTDTQQTITVARAGSSWVIRDIGR